MIPWDSDFAVSALTLLSSAGQNRTSFQKAHRPGVPRQQDGEESSSEEGLAWFPGAINVIVEIRPGKAAEDAFL